MAIATYPSSLSILGSTRDWSEARQTDAVLLSTPRPGLAFMDVLRTFDAIGFIHSIPKITEALRDTLKTFYSDNKGKEFYWSHPRTSVIYLLMHDAPPVFRLNNDDDSWNVVESMTQTSSTVS